MNGFDRGIMLALNQYARHSRFIDELMVMLNRSALLKGGVVVSIFWWLWFAPRAAMREIRSRLLATLTSGFIAIVVGRALALLLPFRARPIHEPSLGFTVPYGTGPGELRGWSSFPSDHSMLFFALATGLGFVSRRAGAFLLLWTLFVICLPRVYAGQHYPTDILGGAVVGIVIALISQRRWLRERIDGPLLLWSERHPQSFYAALFLVTFTIATMFTDLRAMLQVVLHAMGRGGEG
ncbi:MAG TPA: phosphatase PAP2 family protein [Candidatus Udaeobacter sp.]|jgi:undecaprenyl-diphosphatase|nr:phosphatase PAP2 family protein [Candidatus Udaeobacter sp.]